MLNIAHPFPLSNLYRETITWQGSLNSRIYEIECSTLGNSKMDYTANNTSYSILSNQCVIHTCLFYLFCFFSSSWTPRTIFDLSVLLDSVRCYVQRARYFWRNLSNRLVRLLENLIPIFLVNKPCSYFILLLSIRVWVRFLWYIPYYSWGLLCFLSTVL